MISKRKLTAIAFNCSLKRSDAGEESSTDRIIADLFSAFERHGVEGSVERVADSNILPGVTSDEGKGDEWPLLREKIIAADIVILGTPIWLVQPSSIAKRILERMDAFLSETDEDGHMPASGKVAVVAVVGNEDGAHHCHAAMFQALNDVGFTIPANAGVYWVGEAMGDMDYVDLKQTPDNVAAAINTAASNAAHLAFALKSAAYPAVE